MRVLILGAGQFGRTFAQAFSQFACFSDVCIADPDPARLDSVPPGIRPTFNYHMEEPDIIVITASMVDATHRLQLAARSMNLMDFWDIEREKNEVLFRDLLSWFDAITWKILIVATNPSHEWTNALLSLYPDRHIVGFGTAFDNARVKALCAAILSAESHPITDVKVIGAHGKVINVDFEAVPDAVFEVAKWMSDVMSIAFIRAPKPIVRTWSTQVGIMPLVKGLAGDKIDTHLIVQIEYDGVRAATGTDVIVKGPAVVTRGLPALGRTGGQRLRRHLEEMHAIGVKLARSLR